MEKIYSPEFIPYYLDVVKENSLNQSQSLVYWFIRFYTSWGNKFWFKSEQLWKILNVSEWTINNTLSVLEKKKLIWRNTTIMSSQWSKREVWLVSSGSEATVSSTSEATVSSGKWSKR